MSLTKASDIVKAPTREAGGDNEVPRDGMGRPRIIVPCDACNAAGSIPSHKTGRPIKCPKRCAAESGITSEGIFVPKGHRLVAYTRTTTFIDVLDDKSNLSAWGERMVLVGVAREPKLLNDVAGIYDGLKLAEKQGNLEQVKANKDELNRKAQIAKKKAGAEEKADQGTHLHGLSELADEGEEFPKGISYEDFADLDAYRDITAGFRHVHMEKLVVHDNLRVAGTPDRVSSLDRDWIIAHRHEGEREGKWGVEPQTGVVYIVAPNGQKITENDLLITDLKTGTVEYGALKMAMQLALYSRSKLYNHMTGERSSMGRVNQQWGIIWNVPAGSGVGQAYWANLELGWKAIELAREVRQIRTSGRKALTPLAVSSTDVKAA